MTLIHLLTFTSNYAQLWQKEVAAITVFNAPAAVWGQSGMHTEKALEYFQALVEAMMEVLRSLAGLIKDTMKP